MAVWYLDSDDEITDAVARLRNATDEQVVFVVPTGSRRRFPPASSLTTGWSASLRWDPTWTMCSSGRRRNF